MFDLGGAAPVSLAMLVLNMSIGLLLSLIVAWYYEHFAQSLSNRRKFARLLPVLTLTTALIITIVKSSLALTLGLVGALSIVRFRTAIKEPEELMFLFLAITIGLGVGAEQRWATVVGVMVILGYMAARLLFKRKFDPHNLYLNIVVEEVDQETLFDQVNAQLLEYVEVVDFRRLDSRDGALQLTYFIHADTPQIISALVASLKQRFPVREISFIQQDRVLGD
ncbi:MAG: DUF4956 domain-containing protein [Anaerolineae bacterium]|nr:DUF4956 domain-containing protein [Anaerolineae bacterium]